MDVDLGSPVSGPLRRVGRYALFDCVGHGATATVHIGRLLGPAGFSKTVAIKRMHENVGRDPEVAAMFLDEARLSGRIRHPNVVATTDLLALDGETFLVMEYVHGDSLSTLNEALRARGERMPTAIAVHILRDVLLGLHAAHEATDEHGERLHLVHRDVSPHNIQLGIDGSARVLDFGIAKALGRLQDTHLGQVKGKLCYMAPEQLLGQPFDHRVDIFAAGVVLWETLAGRRLFFADNPGQTVQRILSEDVPDLTGVVPGISPLLARAVEKATTREPGRRYATALEFARELERTTELVTARAVGDWVRRTAGERLAQRAERLRQIECTPLTQTGEIPLSAVREELPKEPLRVAVGPDEPTASDVLDVNMMDAARPLRPSTPTDTGQNRTLHPRSSRRWFAAAGASVVLALSLFWASRLERPSARESQAAVDSKVAPVRPEPLPAPAVAHALGEPSVLPTAEPPRTQASEPRAKPAAAAKKREKPARVSPKQSRVNSKVAQKPRPKVTPPARRAEDLFSRN